MSVANSLAPAGRWLLASGIQEPSGGFARYYRAEIEKNKPVSTEISGYAASALIYLFQLTGDEAYLACAQKTAAFLLSAWDPELSAFPFEHPSPSAESEHQTWFFDSGIIIRGLLAVWRVTREDWLLDISKTAAAAMLADFHSGADFHPILALPRKESLPRTDQWSRGPGCYQLKSAMSWWDLAEITGDDTLRDAYLEMAASALASHSTFLPGHADEHRVMDRLHPYAYFLEGLTPLLQRGQHTKVYADGLQLISKYLRQIAPSFARSDVYAQLLRARVFAAQSVPLDSAAAAAEADALRSFQAIDPDPRIHGGFYFGRRHGRMSPHVNPVSTVFALQALEMWRQASAGARPPCPHVLI